MIEYFNTITQYFPDLTDRQKEQLNQLAYTCMRWNEKINVISRKDIDNIEVNHILHSLAIAKFIKFEPGTTVIDLGTGGGFPALPLAIFFPEVKFHLVDRIRKKLGVAAAIADECGLENVTFQHGDFRECKMMGDFVVSRAVMPLPELVKLARRNIKPVSVNAIPNGLIALKGGDVAEEVGAAGTPCEVVDISTYFNEEYFKTKKIIFAPL